MTLQSQYDVQYVCFTLLQPAALSETTKMQYCCLMGKDIDIVDQLQRSIINHSSKHSFSRPVSQKNTSYCNVQYHVMSQFSTVNLTVTNNARDGLIMSKMQCRCSLSYQRTPGLGFIQPLKTAVVVAAIIEPYAEINQLLAATLACRSPLSPIYIGHH